MALVISKLGYNWLIDLQFVFCDENTYKLFFKKTQFVYIRMHKLNWLMDIDAITICIL